MIHNPPGHNKVHSIVRYGHLADDPTKFVANRIASSASGGTPVGELPLLRFGGTIIRHSNNHFAGISCRLSP